jgi:hypothetical protein
LHQTFRCHHFILWFIHNYLLQAVLSQSCATRISTLVPVPLRFAD